MKTTLKLESDKKDQRLFGGSSYCLSGADRITNTPAHGNKTEMITVKTSIMLRSMFGLTVIFSLYAFCLFMVASLAVFAMLFSASRHQAEPTPQPDSFFDIPVNQIKISDNSIYFDGELRQTILSRRA